MTKKKKQTSSEVPPWVLVASEEKLKRLALRSLQQSQLGDMPLGSVSGKLVEKLRGFSTTLTLQQSHSEAERGLSDEEKVRKIWVAEGSPTLSTKEDDPTWGYLGYCGRFGLSWSGPDIRVNSRLLPNAHSRVGGTALDLSQNISMRHIPSNKLLSEIERRTITDPDFAAKVSAIAREIESRDDVGPRLTEATLPKMPGAISSAGLQSSKAEKPLKSATASPGIDEQFVKFPPDKFFKWFDKVSPSLSNSNLMGLFQKWLFCWEGKQLASAEASKMFATSVQDRLNKYGWKLRCPGTADECGVAANLRCNKVGNAVDPRFYFTHGSGTNLIKHGYSKAIPALVVISAPKKSRRKSL